MRRDHELRQTLSQYTIKVNVRPATGLLSTGLRTKLGDPYSDVQYTSRGVEFYFGALRQIGQTQ